VPEGNIVDDDSSKNIIICSRAFERNYFKIAPYESKGQEGLRKSITLNPCCKVLTPYIP
jgi:hypothetical protein